MSPGCSRCRSRRPGERGRGVRGGGPDGVRPQAPVVEPSVREQLGPHRGEVLCGHAAHDGRGDGMVCWIRLPEGGQDRSDCCGRRLPSPADCQPQWLRAGGLEEGGEGREQSQEAPEEESQQGRPRNQHFHRGGHGLHQEEHRAVQRLRGRLLPRPGLLNLPSFIL